MELNQSIWNLFYVQEVMLSCSSSLLTLPYDDITKKGSPNAGLFTHYAQEVGIRTKYF